MVVVGMSGGVDSAVSALLLQRQGFTVRGLFATSWDGRDEDGACPSDADWHEVQRVSRLLGFETQRKSFVSEFWVDVFEPLVAGYQGGETPNVDVLCNRRLKFREMRRHALEAMAADVFATGHYAQLEREEGGKPRLLQSPCDKDQTLFLSQVSCSQLERVLFPVGHLSKEEVRSVAREAGLPNAERKSSTGICFVGKRKFGDWIGDYISLTPGEFVDQRTGLSLGPHLGAQRYTVGQRARLSGEARRWFVVAKTPSGNVVLSPTPPAASALEARDAVWVAERPPVPEGQVLSVTCRYRHTQPLIRAQMTLSSPSSFALHFDSPQPAVAAGQAVAIYQGPVCLGGAFISKWW